MLVAFPENFANDAKIGFRLCVRVVSVKQIHDKYPLNVRNFDIWLRPADQASTKCIVKIHSASLFGSDRR